MTSLTPRTEQITGASLSGSSGDSNRTYTLAYTGFHSVISFTLQGGVIHETYDYSISGGVVTFSVSVLNAFVIELRYFTDDGLDIVTGNLMYCSVNDVYRTAGITSSEVSNNDVVESILEAENYVDRLTNTTYWALEDSGTATAGGSSTLTDSSSAWTVNQYQNDYVWIYGGTGSGQVRQISSHTATIITVDRAWTTNPSTDSTYRIIHTGTIPYVVGLYDGDDTDTFFLPKYPLRLLESVEIDDVSIATTHVYQYADQGKLRLKDVASTSYWKAKKAQLNEINYWFGVYPLPKIIQRLTAVTAAIQVLEQQMGGTFDDPSSIQLPEGSVTVGQQYINIEGTIRRLREEQGQLVERVVKYINIL